jgi:putative two-component system response regulator
MAPRILLIDGDGPRRQRGEGVLLQAGYRVSTATSALAGLRQALEQAPDAVVSELLLPGIDGYELTLELRSAEPTKQVPVILTCAAAERADPDLVDAVGGTALVAGSPDLREVLGALAVCLGPRATFRAAVTHSQRRTVERLARAAEFRDEETANHTERVSRYCGLLAAQSGLDDRRSELIAAASMMHDIGKLGIPDSILRKPGALNIHERLHMQRHAEYGRRILAGEADPLLDLAAAIAWTHHERWDGGGYPRRLGGTEIPLEGRIVAIGDVFDALTSNRVYRPAMSVDHAVALMRASRGTHFDPQLLDLFIDAMPEVLDIRRRHPDRVKSSADPPVSGMLSLGGLVPESRAAFVHARALSCASRRFMV